MRYARLSAALLISLLPWGALAQTTTPPPPPEAPSASPAPKARSPAMKQARAKRRAACAADLQFEVILHHLEHQNEILVAMMQKLGVDIGQALAQAKR